MTTYRSTGRHTPHSDGGTSDVDAFAEITCLLEALTGFLEHHVVKTLKGPEPALVVCRRADGEPVPHAWLKQEPGTGCLYRDFVMRSGSSGTVGSARQVFRDPYDAAHYLTSVIHIPPHR